MMLNDDGNAGRSSDRVGWVISRDGGNDDQFVDVLLHETTSRVVIATFTCTTTTTIRTLRCRGVRLFSAQCSLLVPHHHNYLACFDTQMRLLQSCTSFRRQLSIGFIHFYQPSITLHTDAYLEALRAGAPRFVHGPYSFALPSHVSQHSAAPHTPVVPHDTSTSTGRLRTGTTRLLGGAPASATTAVTAPAASDIEQQQVRASHSAV
jgi:hypothetical protein